MQCSIHRLTALLVAFLAACALALADPQVHTTLSLHVSILNGHPWIPLLPNLSDKKRRTPPQITV